MTAAQSAPDSVPLDGLPLAWQAVEPPSILPPAPGLLILHGGGPGSETARLAALALAGGPAQAQVLILPQAAFDPAEAAAYLVDWFEDQGASHVDVLDPAHASAAQAAVARATLLWMTSGQQVRLLGALGSPALRSLIRQRHAEGCVVGGTSAGAACVGRLVILGDSNGPDPCPPTAPGLDLWPAVVVDTHFAARGREPRLGAVLEARRGLLHGVGIDEGAALLVAPDRSARLLVTGASRAPLTILPRPGPTDPSASVVP